MSAGEFDGAPLVAGTVKGIRSFAVDALGRLRGPQQGNVWRPGENVARCNRQTSIVSNIAYVAGAMSVAVNGGYNVTVKPSVPPVPESRPLDEPGHSLASCRCGFYGYHDGSDDYRADATVSAVVEGYGDVMLGTRGFRAEKARVLALCVPMAAKLVGPSGGFAGSREDVVARQGQRMKNGRRRGRGPLYRAAYRLDDEFTLPLSILAGFLAVGAAAAAYVLAFAPSFASFRWVGLIVAFASLVLSFVSWSLTKASWDRFEDDLMVRYGNLANLSRPQFEPLPADRLALLRRNYPDVPVFDSFDRMVAKFPPDRGAAPSPETDPTFWDRK